MTALCARSFAASKALLWLAAACGFAALASPAFSEEQIAVQLDQARILKLPERAATLVIGDPLIADVSIQPGGLAIVTGKGYGATNIIVMDRGGAVLMEKNLEVKGPPDRVVFVYRGVARNTYSCTPECTPRITLGDDNEFFDKTMSQSATRNTQALGAGAAGGH
jgi:Flp pilus assembly secretin CpaC